MASLDQYTVIVCPDEPYFLAYGPALPGCHAMGATPEEAWRELRLVFSMVADEYSERDEALPPDVPDLGDLIEGAFPPKLRAVV